MQACPQPYAQHSHERQHRLAMEWSHYQQSTWLGSESAASHLQASHEAGRNMGGLQNKNSKKKKRNSWRNMGLPLLIDKILEQHLDYYDVGRVPRRCPNYAGSSCHFEGVERLLGGEAVPLGVWRGIPTTCKGESTKLGSTTEGYSGTHRWRDGLARGMIG